MWEHVVKWTQEQKAWGLIPSGGHVYKCLENVVFYKAVVHLAAMGRLPGAQIQDWINSCRLLHADCQGR